MGTTNFDTLELSNDLTVMGTITAGAGSLTVGTCAVAGTSQASKIPVTDSNNDLGGFRNLTCTGAMTSGTLSVGGGYGSTGCSIAATGNIQTNGTLTVDGASTLTGVVTLTATPVLSSGHIALTPVASPTGTVEGTLYADTDHKLYYYNGTAWKEVAFSA